MGRILLDETDKPVAIWVLEIVNDHEALPGDGRNETELLKGTVCWGRYIVRQQAAAFS